MKIGVIGMPGRHNYNGQSLKPRFFILGVPLFPTSCIYKISDNLGMEIPLTGKDIFHGFAKIHFGLLGVGAFIWMGNLRSSEIGFKIFLAVLAVILGATCLYSWVKHSSAPAEEVERRKIFGKAFLYNMLPEYLPVKIQESLYGELLRTYMGKFKKLDWQQDLEAGNITNENFPLLYTLAYYQKILQASPSNQLLFDKIETFLTNAKKRKANATTSTATATPKSKPATESKIKYNQQASSTTINDKYTQSNTGKIKTAEDALRVINELKRDTKTAEFSTANGTSKSQTTTEEKKATGEKSVLTDIEVMTAKDIRKVRDAKSSMNNQLAFFIGSMLFGFVIVGVISGGGAMLFYVLLAVMVIIGIILAFTFLPDYSKINDDLKTRKKRKVTVRIKDMAQEGNTTYLILKPNSFKIDKITASGKYYNTALLNKELDIYVSKYSHTLLEIVELRY